MVHIWKCPALAAEQSSLVNSINEKLIELNLPYAQKRLPTLEEKLIPSIFRKLRRNRTNNHLADLGTEKLRRLASDFWKTNRHTHFPLSLFISKTSILHPKCLCVKKKDHVCGHKNIIAIPDDLAEILRNQFALNVEANTSALGRSALFDEWCSTNENDLSFGSIGAFWKANLEGKNCLLVCTENDNVNIKRFNEKIKSLIVCKQPTRVLIILPTQIFQKLGLPPRKVLELASVPTTFPLIRPEEAENSTFSTNETFSIILTLNQESMLIDPIHWESFKTNFLLWGGKYCKNIEISSVTDKLFNRKNTSNSSASREGFLSAFLRSLSLL